MEIYGILIRDVGALFIFCCCAFCHRFITEDSRLTTRPRAFTETLMLFVCVCVCLCVAVVVVVAAAGVVVSLVIRSLHWLRVQEMTFIFQCMTKAKIGTRLTVFSSIIIC